MSTITSNISRTLNGSTAFTVGTDTYTWSGRRLETLNITAPDDAPLRTVNLTLSSKSWGADLLQFRGNANVTINDTTTGVSDTDRVSIDFISFGSTGSNSLTLVNAEAAVIKGFGGKETIKIGYFAEAVLLGRGDDTLILTGDGEVDQVNLGRGNDKLTTTNGGVGTVDMARGNDIVTLGMGGAQFINLGRDADTIKFNALTSSAIVEGGEGISDDLPGAKDSDTVDFSAFSSALTIDLNGRSYVDGAAGSILINNFENATGGKGKDTIIADVEVNVLKGGTAADTFVFESKTAAHGDKILDFSQTEKDKISLSAIDANTVLSGNQAFTFIGTAAFSDKAGQLRYELTSGDTIIQGDINGDGVRDFSIILDASVALKVGDFIL